MKKFLAVLLCITIMISVFPTALSAFALDGEQKYKTGDIIEFGSYPQSKVTDESLISQLDGISKEWISYDYCIKSVSSDFMKYADVELNNEKYRAVTFSRFRPAYADREPDETFSYQSINGYELNTIYYFKFEPVRWRILDPDSGLIMSEIILDAQPFVSSVKINKSNPTGYQCLNNSGNYASDYSTSEVREWLISSFYNSAFSAAEDSLISSVEIKDNNSYFSSKINDKIFLLSKDDLINTKYGFISDEAAYDSARVCSSFSDYSISQGMYTDNSNSLTYHKAAYMLRTSYFSDSVYYATAFDGIVRASSNEIGFSAPYSPDAASPLYLKGIRPAIVLEDINNTAHEHSYQITSVTDPTCTERGYTTYTCSGCGKTYTDNFTSALGHNFGEWAVTVPASCTKKGTETRYCSRCDEVETREIKSDGHNYVSVITDPTCTEKGYTTYTCSECGDTYTDDFTTALGHNFGEWTVTVPASCTEKGTETRYCSRCDEIETREISVIEHSYAMLAHKDASCVQEGETVYKCTECGDSYSVSVPVVPHSLKHIYEDASCTADGEEYDICMTCGEFFNHKTIPAKGHNYINGVCTVCGNLRDWEFSVSGSNLTITKYKGTDKNLVIPETLVGYKVTSVADSAFKDCKTLEYVRIPDNVLSIGNDAFRGCSNLKEVYIGEKTGAVGSGAFYDCPKLALICVMNKSVLLKNVFGGNDKRLVIYAYDNSSAAKSASSSGLTVVPFDYPKEKDGKNAIAFFGNTVLYQDLDYNFWGEIVRKYPDTYYLYFDSLTFDGVKEDDFEIDIDDSHIADSKSLTLNEVYIGLNLNGRQLTFRELSELLHHGQLGSQIEFTDNQGHKKNVFEKIGEFFSNVFNALSRAINSIIRIFKRR